MLKKLNSEKSLNDTSEQYNFVIIFIFVFLSGLILPIVLIPVVKLTGYSEIIEEIAKAAVIFFLILKLSNRKTQIISTLAFGFLFGLSESFLYLSNIIQSGDFSVFWQRFLLAVPMHMITALLILFFCSFKKWLVFMGIFFAIILHLLFNQLAIF
jgi:hypothetical protein